LRGNLIVIEKFPLDYPIKNPVAVGDCVLFISKQFTETNLIRMFCTMGYFFSVIGMRTVYIAGIFGGTTQNQSQCQRKLKVRSARKKEITRMHRRYFFVHAPRRAHIKSSGAD
jgi:hypothetical protein